MANLKDYATRPEVAIIVDNPRLKQPTDRFTDEEIPESALTDDLVVIADDPDALTGGPVDYSQTPVGFASLPLPLVRVSVDENHGGNIEDATGAGSIEQIRERGAVLSETPRLQSTGFVNIPAGSIVNADGKITESNDPPPRGKLG